MGWISDPLPEDSLPEIPLSNIANVGTKGDKIKLKANYFLINFQRPNVIINHFDVKITEEFSIQQEESSKNSVLASVPDTSGSSGQNGIKKKKKKKSNIITVENVSTDVQTEEMSSALKRGSEISPNTPKLPKALKRKIVQAFVEQNSKIFQRNIMAYDGGSSAYSTASPNALKTRFTCRFEFEDPEEGLRSKHYKLEWKLVESVELNKLLDFLREEKHMPEQCQTLFHGLEVMFNYERTQRFSASSNHFFPHGENVFGPNFKIGRGKEGVRGFFMSLQPCQGWKDGGALMLNIGVSHKVFYSPQPVLEYLKTLPNGKKLFVDYTKKLKDEAIKVIEENIIKKEIKVELIKTKQTYKRKYLVKEVSPENPASYTFEVTKGDSKSKRSVAEHFKEVHGTELKYLRLNCFVMTNGAYVPIEACQIVAKQQVKGKLSKNESRDFIQNTTLSPETYQRKVKEIFNTNKFTEDSMLEELGVSIESEMVSVDGRVLPAPVVMLSKTKTADVQNGKWTIGREDKFNNPSQLARWGILNFSSEKDSPQKICQLKKMLISVASKKGMNPKDPKFVEDFRDVENHQLAEKLQRLKEENLNLQLIIFVNEEENRDVYKLMKSLCDGELNIATQCVLSRTLERQSSMLITNILLKINAKLGEVSHVSVYSSEEYPIYKELFLRPVMVMGADVNHPGAGDRTMPSMAAVVASVDKFASIYVHEVRHQTTRNDIIEDMKEITQNLLEQFRSKIGSLPERIIMYRDGVSNTQFSSVLAYELRAMREACVAVALKLNQDYKPPMTFLCVQKRHHTRFFHANPSGSDSRSTSSSDNVPPGTVVDTVITTHSNRNFFLCSHAGVKGTSRPVHYTVLWDDSDLSMDQLQLLTYSLCYNYVRCSQAVSMPSPVFYADRAAYRAKTRLEGEMQRDETKWRNALLKSKDGKYPEDLLRKAVRVDKSMPASRKMSFV